MTTTIDVIYDGEVLRPQGLVDLQENGRYRITIEELPSLDSPGANAWDILESLIGTVDAPADWSTEHDHYISGAPKRNPSE